MTSAFPWAGAAAASLPGDLPQEDPDRIAISLCLNAYAFNSLLRNGKMNLEQLFRFAKEAGFQGVDLTADYIPGYPDIPTDEVLYKIKRMAFRLGLARSGTGVRNNFTLADPEQRKQEKQLVKNRGIAASKPGIPHVRIFDQNGQASRILPGGKQPVDLMYMPHCMTKMLYRKRNVALFVRSTCRQ